MSSGPQPCTSTIGGSRSLDGESSQMTISNTVRNRPVPVLYGLMVVSLAGLMPLPPFLQNQGYHRFADQRTLFGIPNFWNVVSNLPFIAVGAAGLLRFRRDPVTVVLFAGIFLTGFGSSYYRLNPNDSTLFWDRLPMTLCFAAILAAVVQERVDTRAGVILLRPLLAAGVFSLLLWRWTDDLRLYAWRNFFPFSHRSLCSNFSRRNIPAHSIGLSLRRFTRSPSCWSTMTTRFFRLDRFERTHA